MQAAEYDTLFYHIGAALRMVERMKIDCGFSELFGKNDKMLGRFFKEPNNRDILGLYKMNVRISNVLFPFGNTLMPNLVYFYYLNAIYYVLKEKNGKIPSQEEINRWEIKISKAITTAFANVHKGFLVDARNRAYAKYKSSMERMHFFEEGWKAWEKLERPALECLKDTNRYRFVKRIIEKEFEEIKFGNGKNETWPYRLEKTERLDFIRRVVLPYNDYVPYSVFSNIVMYYAMLTKRPDRMSTIYTDKWIDDYDKKREKKYEIVLSKSRAYSFDEIKTFDGLYVYFSNVNDGTLGINRIEDYQIARDYSKLQLIAKLVYKVCLFEGVKERQSDYLTQLQREINEFRENKKGCEFEKFTRNVRVENKYRPFLVERKGETDNFDEELLDAFQFVGKVAACIKDGKEQRSNDEVISDMKKLVIDREAEVMGDNSILNSGVRTEHARRDSEDTFRWQYRPDYEFETSEPAAEADAALQKNEDEVQAEDAKVSFVWKKRLEKDERNRLSTMSASYYIYELFFEPYVK